MNNITGETNNRDNSDGRRTDPGVRRGIFIPANNSEPLKVVELENYEDYRRMIDGWLETIPFPGRDDVAPYFDEEGKVKGKDKNARATVLLSPVMFPNDYIAGDCLLMGFDIETGEDLDVPEDLVTDLMEA